MLRFLIGRANRGRSAEAMRAEANTLFDTGRYGEAHELYERLLALHDDPRARVNLGYCLLLTGAGGQAEPHFRAALAHSDTAPNARVGLGDAAVRRGDHATAAAHYREAITLAPDFAIAHNNLSLSLAALGEFEEAYREAEWRYALSDTRAFFPHRVALPRWRGESLGARRLLVHWEQGFGDIIQHLRFLPLLRERGARFVFDCPPPLLPLARCVARDDELRAARADGLDVSGFDLAVPLLSLPHVLGITWSTLPHAPYLFAAPARSEALRAAWRSPGRKLVGLAWRSSGFDPARNLGLAELLAALDPAPVRYVALQVDLSPEERNVLVAHDAVEGLAAASDFGETAAALAAVDWVVSVDTAVAHLAGGMGQPAFILLNEPAAVRWMIGRADSPWYPTTRLVRRASNASPRDVMGPVRTALQSGDA